MAEENTAVEIISACGIFADYHRYAIINKIGFHHAYQPLHFFSSAAVPHSFFMFVVQKSHIYNGVAFPDKIVEDLTAQFKNKQK